MIFLLQNSLLSTLLSLYLLLRLYSPSIFLQFIFSPVIFSTLILLLYLLRLGVSQNCTIELIESDSVQPQFLIDDCNSDLDSDAPDFESDLKQESPSFCADSFVEWDVRAPLEVIYEEHEGEDAEENYSESKMNVMQRYASLSLFYPESDSDASSDGDYAEDGGWNSREDACFRWDEDDRDGLIEIALDDLKRKTIEVEEDNLIEIDLSPAR